MDTPLGGRSGGSAELGETREALDENQRTVVAGGEKRRARPPLFWDHTSRGRGAFFGRDLRSVGTRIGVILSEHLGAERSEALALASLPGITGGFTRSGGFTSRPRVAFPVRRCLRRALKSLESTEKADRERAQAECTKETAAITPNTSGNDTKSRRTPSPALKNRVPPGPCQTPYL
ncbi:hypothetical protein KM043_012126 [Ampulex compressa]|nr:hypothetical protein KM043_012126 [Ampulex compressa]